MKSNGEFAQVLRTYGVQPSYVDVQKRRCAAPTDSLIEVLRCLGADLKRPEEAGELLDRRMEDRFSEGIEPVIVAWDGQPARIRLALPVGQNPRKLACYIRADGQTAPIERSSQWEKLPIVADPHAERHGYEVRELALPVELPTGYHWLSVEAAGKTLESLVISAPSYCYRGNTGDASGSGASTAKRGWGCFLPLYALRSDRNWGAGDFTDLAEYTAWISRQGGTAVGTLPLLAAYLDEPFDPSPYAPASRLFWNEFYVDVTAIPELAQCEAARRLIGRPELARELESLRNTDLVDYRRVMTLKRQMLESLAEHFFADRNSHTPRYRQFQAFAEANPAAHEYACFRATMERRRQSWQQWPRAMRDGRLTEGSFDPRSMRYHWYSQWIAREQIDTLYRSSAETTGGLYLDFPLGVRHDGFDTWRHQDLYALSANAGSPPDTVWTRGQDWSFPPLHPDAIRRDGYRHFRAMLDHNLQFAGRLRIDHVMSLHRLYWIPAGLAADQGVYVRYRAGELYALLSLESHRHRCRIVGEDLGTVPPEVSRSMEAHRLGRMYVVQYELEPHRSDALTPVSPGGVASVNTHDMPTFAGWWLGGDISERRALGLLDERAANAEQQERERLKDKLGSWLDEQGWCREEHAEWTGPDTGLADCRRVLAGVLRYLAASPAELLLVNLEDLWSETRPQNTPGTSGDQRPSWRRKARYPLEQFVADDRIHPLLAEISELRSVESRVIRHESGAGSHRGARRGNKLQQRESHE